MEETIMISDLLLKYREQISVLERMFKEKKDPSNDDILTNMDEIFLLRYLLSNDFNVEVAARNIEFTLKWRMEHEEIIRQVRKSGKAPNEDIMLEGCKFAWCGSLERGDPIFVVRSGLSNTKQICSKLTPEEIKNWFIFHNEIAFQKCDFETRRRGYLVKVVMVIDLFGFSLFSGRNDSTFIKAQGAASNLSQILYPQLLGKTVAVNAPSSIKVLVSMLSVFMNKRAMEKNALCPVKDSKKKDASSCPYLKRHNAVGSIPEFLGGSLLCPHDLHI